MTLNNFRATVSDRWPFLVFDVVRTVTGVRMSVFDSGTIPLEEITTTIQDNILPIPLELELVIHKTPVTDSTNLWVWYAPGRLIPGQWVSAEWLELCYTGDQWISEKYAIRVAPDSVCLKVQTDQPTEPPAVDDVYYEFPRSL